MTAEHSSWEELAVGQALGALEPADEQAFLEHLRGCDLCARTLADMEAVTSQLAYGVEPAEPPPALLTSIMSEVHASDRVRQAPPQSARRQDRVGDPVSLEARRRRRDASRGAHPAWLAAAASFVMVIGMTAWNLHLRAENQVKARALSLRNQVASALADPTTQTATLASDRKPDAHAQVLVKGDQAYLVVEGLEMNDRTSSVYVLWRAGADGHMDAAATFDIRHGGPSIIPITDLGEAGAVRQFAVSIESGRTAPATPSTPIAKGSLAT